MKALIHRFRALMLLLAGSLLLSACDFDVYRLPLPGGTDVGEDPLVVTVMFADVLDLVPKSTVKVNDVSVGMVKDIELDGYVAKATLELQEDVELPDNAIAQIRQTSLLGEKFVSLSPPPEGSSSNPLESGDVIPIERSGRNPEVEEVLGALSLLLNGGGIGQLQTINREINLALEGREDSARSVFRQIDELMAQFDANKGDIVDAIESLNRLAISVKAQLPTIDATLEQLPSALRTIDAQRGDLVRMLKALNRLGDIGVRVIKASKDSTIASFRQLVPVLTELSNSGDNFAKAFHVFLTYPFVDEVVGRDPQVARNLHMGDYTNLSVELKVSLPDGTGPTLPTPTGPVTGVVCQTWQEIRNNLPDDPTIQQIKNRLDRLCDRTRAREIRNCLRNQTAEACENVPGYIARAVAEDVCAETPNNPLCDELGGVLNGGNNNNGNGGTPSGPLGGLGGLNRAGFGPADSNAPRGPTMGDLVKAYDADLVALLVPGMVVR